MLYTINVLLTGIVLILCLILLFVKAANAEATVKQNAAKIHYDSKKKVIKVMVIDTGIDGSNPLLRHFMPEVKPNSKLDGRNLSNYIDDHGHGTHITGLILFGKFYPSEKLGHWTVRESEILCDNIQIYSCKYYSDHGSDGDNAKRLMGCFERAYKEKMNVINYSGGGRDPFKIEYDLISLLTHNHHVVVTTSMGNGNSDLRYSTFYPAGYSTHLGLAGDYKPLTNIIPVGALTKDGKKRFHLSNYGLDVPQEIGEDVVSILPKGVGGISGMGYMSGTSQATAIYTHKLLIEKCKELNK